MVSSSSATSCQRKCSNWDKKVAFNCWELKTQWSLCGCREILPLPQINSVQCNEKGKTILNCSYWSKKPCTTEFLEKKTKYNSFGTQMDHTEFIEIHKWFFGADLLHTTSIYVNMWTTFTPTDSWLFLIVLRTAAAWTFGSSLGISWSASFAAPIESSALLILRTSCALSSAWNFVLLPRAPATWRKDKWIHCVARQLNFVFWPRTFGYCTCQFNVQSRQFLPSSEMFLCKTWFIKVVTKMPCLQRKHHLKFSAKTISFFRQTANPYFWSQSD